MRLAARIPIPVLTLHLLLLGAQPAARADDLPGFRPLGCGRTDLMLGQVPALIGASSMQDEVYAYRHATAWSSAGSLAVMSIKSIYYEIST